MEYDYRGTKIELSEKTGSFIAVIAGARVTAPSLQSIKNRVDKTLDGEFRPFTALVFERYGRKLREVTVTGIKEPRKSKHSWARGDRQWLLSVGDPVGEVIEDTPENRKAIKDWADHAEETRRIAEARSNEQAQLWAAVKRLKPKNKEGE